MTLALIATAQIHESTQYEDVTLRVFTSKGSTPILIVGDGFTSTPEEIGRGVLEAFDYFIESPVFERARWSAPLQYTTKKRDVRL